MTFFHKAVVYMLLSLQLFCVTAWIGGGSVALATENSTTNTPVGDQPGELTAEQKAEQATRDANTNMGILSGEDITQKKLRDGNVGFEDIPKVIRGATNFLIGISGSISVVMIIAGAFRMVLGSVQNDKSKGKDSITYGIIGLIVSTSGWFLLQLVIEGLFSN